MNHTYLRCDASALSWYTVVSLQNRMHLENEGPGNVCTNSKCQHLHIKTSSETKTESGWVEFCWLYIWLDISEVAMYHCLGLAEKKVDDAFLP